MHPAAVWLLWSAAWVQAWHEAMCWVVADAVPKPVEVRRSAVIIRFPVERKRPKM